MIEYIEREAAKFDFEIGDPDVMEDFGLLDGAAWGFSCNLAKEMIDTIPAADVRPVVRAEWIATKDENKKRCSRCDVITLIAQYPHGEANYCPDCGADMKKE